MKRSSLRILSLVLAMLTLWVAVPAVSMVSAADNLFENGDFETGNINGWQKYQSTAVTAEAAHSGSYGACLRGAGNWGALLQQTITNLTVGKTCRFSFWYKTFDGSSANVTLCAGSNDQGTRYGYAYTTNGSWTQFGVEFEAVDTMAHLNICGANTGVSERIYVDDFVLSEVVLCEDDDDPNLKMVTDLKDNIKTQGRTAMISGTLMLDFSISGMEFDLDCEGDVYATFNARKIGNVGSNGGLYFTIVVDGETKQRDYCRLSSTGETKVLLAKDLPAGKHSFAIYRQSEHSTGEAGVCALSYNGVMLDRPADKDVYIEFIGDSISCGFGNLGNKNQGDGSALWSDGTQAYTYLTARTLDADWSNVSWSGLGCKYGYSTTTMQDVYPAQRYNYNQTAQYDFAKQPDVIVLALGTNDNSTQGNTALKRAGLVEMLRLVRSKNPNVPIVWIYNMMTDGVNGMIEDIVDEFGGEKAGYYACSLTRNTAGGGWHPDLEGQKTFATELSAFLLSKGLCRAPVGRGELLSNTGVARMETGAVHGGLGFRFELNATGVKMAGGYSYSLSNATVDAYGDGAKYKLVGMGAILSNDAAVGTDPTLMTLDNLSKNTVRVNARRLMGVNGNRVSFTARVINIPRGYENMTVYARPYYVFERNGQQVVTYGDVVSSTYNASPQFNDGALIW